MGMRHNSRLGPSIEKAFALPTRIPGWSGCYREARAPAEDRYSGKEKQTYKGWVTMMAQEISAPLAAAINALQNDVDGLRGVGRFA